MLAFAEPAHAEPPTCFPTEVTEGDWDWWILELGGTPQLPREKNANKGKHHTEVTDARKLGAGFRRTGPRRPADPFPLPPTGNLPPDTDTGTDTISTP